MSELIGWHFSTGRLGYGDNREIVIGETHTIDVTQRKLELCEWGLHASERIIDALNYAPGPMVYRVRLHGEILHGNDKACATHRTYIDGIDATDILREFIRRCALDVIHLWDAPDVAREYLETGDESLRDAARATARTATRDWDATWTTTWDAARAATWAATWDATWTAIWVVARDVAWNVAWAAALGAAWAAVRDAQNTRLTDMVQAAMAKQRGNHELYST